MHLDPRSSTDWQRAGINSDSLLPSHPHPILQVGLSSKSPASLALFYILQQIVHMKSLVKSSFRQLSKWLSVALAAEGREWWWWYHSSLGLFPRSLWGGGRSLAGDWTRVLFLFVRKAVQPTVLGMDKPVMSVSRWRRVSGGPSTHTVSLCSWGSTWRGGSHLYIPFCCS